MRPHVKISDGELLGKKSATTHGKVMYSFKGIPYAKPPLGELRFQPPQPVEPWCGARDASYERNVCHQPHVKLRPSIPSFREICNLVLMTPAIYRFFRGMTMQSEDCLYLNVYTPKVSLHGGHCTESPNLPVVFFIHGGGFLVGSAREEVNNMELFVEKGVVAVTINYRLGPFGFLSLDTPSAPGNAGLKDMVQALRWVRDNISQFGGDPNRVTVYGHSAGGGAAHLLTLSPMARGLLHRAIASSGYALCDWVFTTDHVKRAKEFAKVLGIEANDPEELVTALRAVPAGKVASSLLKYAIYNREQSIYISLPFVASLEKQSKCAFITQHPETILKEGKQAPVPFIAGVTNLEGSVWFLGVTDITVGMYKINTLKADLAILNQQREKFIPPEIHKVLSENERKEVADMIVEYYCGTKGLCESTEEDFIQLFGDVMFILNFIRTISLHASTSHAPVYAYRFTFDGRLASLRRILQNRPYTGAVHGADWCAICPPTIMPFPAIHPDEPEGKVRDRLLELFVSFVETGVPTCTNTMQDFHWETVTNTKMDYLEMSEEFEMKRDKLGSRFQFWDALYKRYLNRPLLI